MKSIAKVMAVVAAILVVGTLAIESEAQGHGIDGRVIDSDFGIIRASAFLPPPPPFPPIIFSHNDRDNHRHNYQPRHRNFQVCWEEVVRVERRHGGYRNETRTVCRDRGRRDYDRGDWREEHHRRDRW